LQRFKTETVRRVFPGLFTVANSYCGFLSVIYAIDGNYLTAAWLIILAAVMDGIDGMVARITRGYSRFGVELDSLADIISFGLAPSVLLYTLYFHQMGKVGVVISFLPLLCGGIRLARFNIMFTGYEKENYVGLPIPMQAITLSSFIIFNFDIWNDLKLPQGLIPMIMFLSLLMISTIEYESLPKFTLRKDTKNLVKLVIFLLASLTIMLFPRLAIFPFIFIFVLHGVVRWGWHLLHHEEDEVANIPISD